MRKAWFTLIILLTVISLLSIAQTVQSQQYTTATVTSLVTGTQATTIIAGTQTLTTIQAQSAPIFSAPVTIPGTHGVCGIYFEQAFTATSGNVLTGTLTSNNPVDLYVMTDSAFKTWSHQVVAGGTCTPTSLILSEHNTTSYNFNTTIPSNGSYQIILNNLSQKTITAQLTTSLITTAPAIATLTLYSTEMQETAETLLQTTTGTIQTSNGSTVDQTTLGAIVLMVVIILVVVYVIMKRRSATK